jgi:hypothetical protein
MRIKDLLNEASRAERERQREARRQAQLQAQRDAEQAARDEAARREARRQAKLAKKLAAPVAPQPAPQPKIGTGLLSSPELEKYMVNPDIDTEYSGGYYLKFHVGQQGVYAYWTLNVDIDFDSIVTNFGKNQVKLLGTTFNPQALDQIIQYLLSKSKDPRTGQLGYVHILVDKQLLDPIDSDYWKFFRQLVQHIAGEYPRDEYSADAHVNWEVS